MPTPRHASCAAIDPVETVTPPTVALSLMIAESRKVRTGVTGPVLLYLFYAELNLCAATNWPRRSDVQLILLLCKVDLFVFVPSNGGADLSRILAELGLLIGKEAFLGAG